MKKILVVILAAAFAFSCKPGPSYSTQYTAVTTFEYDAEYGVDYLKEFAKDSTFYDAQNGLALGWGDLGFFHKVSEIDKSFQGGWKHSYQRPVGDGRDAEKPAGYVPSNYRSMGPHTGSSNKTYAVFCQNEDPTGMPERDVKFMSAQYGTCTPSQCWVNNSEAVYEAVKQSFGASDRLVLKATGYLGGVKTDEVSIQMAAADTIMYNWSKLDLTKLGNVDAIDFELTSTKGDIPMYFCMDELSARIAIEIE